MMSRFDTLASQWDSNPVRAAVPFESDWRLMDFGAGTGLLTLGLLDAVGAVVAVDSSTGMLAVLDRKIAEAGLTQVTTCAVNLTEQPWTEPPVDGVVSLMTLHHIEDVPALLARLVAALKPGGWLALADLDSEDGSFHGPDITDAYHHGFAREQVAKWLAAAGCVEVAVGDAWQVTRPDLNGLPRTYGVFLAVARRAS